MSAGAAAGNGGGGGDPAATATTAAGAAAGNISRADLVGAAKQLEAVLGIPLVVKEGADGGMTVWEARRSGRRKG
jgi:hypothetical protein